MHIQRQSWGGGCFPCSRKRPPLLPHASRMWFYFLRQIQALILCAPANVPLVVLSSFSTTVSRLTWFAPAIVPLVVLFFATNLSFNTQCSRKRPAFGYNPNPNITFKLLIVLYRLPKRKRNQNQIVPSRVESSNINNSPSRVVTGWGLFPRRLSQIGFQSCIPAPWRNGLPTKFYQRRI